MKVNRSFIKPRRRVHDLPGCFVKSAADKASTFMSRYHSPPPLPAAPGRPSPPRPLSDVVPKPYAIWRYDHARRRWLASRPCSHRPPGHDSSSLSKRPLLGTLRRALRRVGCESRQSLPWRRHLRLAVGRTIWALHHAFAARLRLPTRGERRKHQTFQAGERSDAGWDALIQVDRSFGRYWRPVLHSRAHDPGPRR